MSEGPLPIVPDPSLPSAAAAARLVRNGLAFWSSKFVVLLTLFAWQIVLARELGPATYGIYGAIGAILVVAAVLPDLGLGLVAARDVARQPDSAPRILAAALLIQPPLAVLAAVLVTGVGWRLDATSGLGLLVVFAALTLVTETVGNVCHSQFIGAGRLGPPAAIALLHTVVLVGLGSYLLWHGWGLWGVYGATLAASILRAVAYGYQLGLAGVRPAWPAPSSVVAGLVREGWPIALLGLVGLARLYADKLVVMPVLGTAATGQLQASFVVIFGIVEFVNGTLLTAVLPAMSRASHAGAAGGFTYQVERLTCFSLLAGVPLAFAGTIFATRFCGLLFGPGFEETPRLLSMFLWVAAMTMVGNGFAQALVVQGRQRTLLAIRTMVLGLFLVLLVLLVNRVGLMGAALASLVTEVGGLGLLGGALGFPASTWRKLFGEGFRIVVAAAAAVGAARILDPAAGPLALLTVAVLYPAAVVALRVISPSEWKLLGETFRTLAGGPVRG